MADYFQSACEIFVTETGKTMKPASTPFAPEINSEDLDHLLNTPGKFSAEAASFIMKLMCGARMAVPQICVIVSRLAGQIAKWSADSDRRLLRVYGYLHANADKVLTGTLAKSDRKHLKIIAWPDADLNGDVHEEHGRLLRRAHSTRGGGLPPGLGLPQTNRDRRRCMHAAEAETVTLAHCCRQEIIPLQILLQAMLGEPVDCTLKGDNAACIIAVTTKGYPPSLRHVKRMQRIALGHPHEIFFGEETDDGKRLDGSAIMDGKFTLEKAATADHKGDIFTKELHPAQFEHALNLIRIGCKAIAPPPKSPIPDKPNLEVPRRAAVSISAKQRRWGNNAGNHVKEQKANPDTNIPEITTKAAPATITKNNMTEKDDKIADKYGAPPPPPEEQCPAHLGYATPLPPPRGRGGAPSLNGAVNAVPAPKTVPLKMPPPNLFGSNPVRPQAPTWKPPPPAHLWRAPATTTTTATASWTSWTPTAPASPRRVYSAWDDVPDEHC